jgi:hypothetical protein
VEARFRDIAYQMLQHGRQVDKSMVKHLEALLLLLYDGNADAMMADRRRREDMQYNFFAVRPKDRTDDSWQQNRDDPGDCQCMHHFFVVLK